jgi:hypothetical protein
MGKDPATYDDIQEFLKLTFDKVLNIDVIRYIVKRMKNVKVVDGMHIE